MTMPFAQCLPAVFLLLAALVTGRCQADELPPKVVEFFRARDAWLLQKIMAEMPAPQTPVQDSLKDEEAQLTAHKTQLESIQQRIDTNKDKPSRTAFLKKDEARLKEVLDAVQASEARIAK